MSTNTSNNVEPTMLSAEIFRAYDIRGIVDSNFFAEDAFRIAYAFAMLIRRNSANHTIIVGRDNRNSSPKFKQQVIKGLQTAGLQIIDVGVAPTPLVYFSLFEMDVEHAMVITASHNPANYNGIKMVMNQANLTADQIQDLYKLSVQQTIYPHGNSSYRREEGMVAAYINCIEKQVLLSKPFKIAIDCGNATSALIAPELFERLGCEVVTLNKKLDGDFPAHPPDPTVPANIITLIKTVVHQKLDFGIAFDGDSDRVIMVDERGQIIWPDQMLMLLAQSILIDKPGSTVVYDIKCSSKLPVLIEKCRGQKCMTASGHTQIKAAMKAYSSPLGGEFSGHIMIKDNWHGFDDGIYAAARLAHELSKYDASAHSLFHGFRASFCSPEYNIPTQGSKHSATVMAAIIDSHPFDEKQVTAIDGLRVDLEDAWGLVRSSNTTPSISVRFEADNEAALIEIKQQFIQLIEEAGLPCRQML